MTPDTPKETPVPSFIATSADNPRLHPATAKARRIAATKPGGVVTQAIWAELLEREEERHIDPRRVGHLTCLADRAHEIWYDHALPIGDEPLSGGQWNTIGWTCSRYGDLSTRELGALVDGGAPFREDIVTPMTPQLREFLAQSVPMPLDPDAPDDMDLLRERMNRLGMRCSTCGACG